MLPVGAIITDSAPAYDASEYPMPGQAIPSATLRVDRGAGIVIRSYRDAEGRLVEEHWRIGETP
jgi:YD repeat-containing protein